ncbi:MAG: adenylate/guanylate cyclase domain-containing protein [Candidatus Eremiobacteraeota bacterium]|nr:adenylate/guanylate cyclase domain-containing protein [Candidatus Eremiobacteraeota bacterium]
MATQPPVPTGTVTFLFTDIEESTDRWEQHASAMQSATRRHDSLLSDIVVAHGGHVFKTVGDEFCTVFSAPGPALTAALAIQRAVVREDWGDVRGLRVRMALHTGVTDERNGDYYGRTVNRVARLMAAGHGGQILVSAATAELARTALPPGARLLSLGAHRLNNLAEAEQIYQLTHPELPADFPPLKSLDARPNNLPLQVASFIGRTAELVEIDGLFRKTRLLTLAGPGGAGKTRLALELAANAMPKFTDGVWFVDLSPLTDPIFVPSAVLSALALREESGQANTVTLLQHLKTKNALIVLDNCEQVVEESAKLADALQRGCAELRILVTSREALGIAGETVYRVPTIAEPEAMQIFAARAEAVVPTFAIAESNSKSVAQICRRLDGNPMAIELAAARIKVMTAEQILGHLDDRFRVLTGGSRTASARQQTLRGMLQWSFDLLSEAEKAMLRRLSVFAADWPLGAVRPICADDPLEDWESLDILTKLVDKSLVDAIPGDGEERYRLLESTRAYARERLTEAGEGERTHAKHAAFWLEFCLGIRAAMRSTPEWPTEAARLRREYTNVRAVLGWAVSEGHDIVLGAALAESLRLFWYYAGQNLEGRYWLGEIIKRADPADPKLLAVALFGYGSIPDYSDGAIDALREAIRLFELLGENVLAPHARNNLALIHLARGEFGESREQLEAALAVERAQRPPLPESPHLLVNLAKVDWEESMDAARAEPLLTKALRAAGPDNRFAVRPHVLLYQARIAGWRHEDDAAFEKFGESLNLWNEFGNEPEAAWVLTFRANLRRSSGDARGARADLHEALKLLLGNRDTKYILDCLDVFAGLAAELREWEAAGKIIGFSDAFLASNRLGRGLQTSLLIQEARARARGAIGEAAFERASTSGRAMEFEEAAHVAASF